MEQQKILTNDNFYKLLDELFGVITCSGCKIKCYEYTLYYCKTCENYYCSKCSCELCS